MWEKLINVEKCSYCPTIPPRDQNIKKPIYDSGAGPSVQNKEKSILRLNEKVTLT